MKDIIEYKVILLDKKGNYGLYSKSRSMSNSECITEYTKTHFRRSMTLQSFVKNGHIAILNNKDVIEAYMPNEISDEQLYELDLLPLKMNGIKRMVVKKANEEVFVLDDKIDERFSSEVIQSYFNKPKQKEK